MDQLTVAEPVVSVYERKKRLSDKKEVIEGNKYQCGGLKGLAQRKHLKSPRSLILQKILLMEQLHNQFMSFQLLLPKIKLIF